MSPNIHYLTVPTSTLCTAERGWIPQPLRTGAQEQNVQHSHSAESKNGRVNLADDSPEEMQRKDPLGTQVWRFYHKQLGQLPNAERLENLTWRMMSMTLRRKGLERRH